MERDINIILPDQLLCSLEFSHSFVVNRAGYYHKPSDYHMDNVVLDEAVLILCLDGTGYVEYKERKQVIHRGDMIFLEPQTLHSYGTDDEDAWTILWVHFKGGGLPELLSLFKRYGINHIFHMESHQYAAEELKDIILLLQNQYTSINIYKACCKLEMILLSFFDAYPRSISKENHYREDAVRFMNENLYNNIDLQAISQYLGISTFHTIRIYKTAFLSTPMQYYNMLRLNEAGRLLLHTDWTVEEISRRLGYSSQFYFSKQFKKKMGVSPSSYKKLMSHRY